METNVATQLRESLKLADKMVDRLQGEKDRLVLALRYILAHPGDECQLDRAKDLLRELGEME